MLASRAESSTPPATQAGSASGRGPGVHVLDPLADDDWDEKLATYPNALPFHTRAWARVLNGAYGFEPTYLGFGRGCDMRAILPMMSIATWATPRRAISLPFTDNCPILTTDAAARDVLVNAACDLTSARGWRRVEFRGSVRDEVEPTSARFFHHVLDLGGTLDAIKARFTSSVRRAIRKAEKSDVAASAEQHIDAMRAFVSLHRLTRQRHGVPPQPWRFFRQVHDHMITPGHGFIVLAKIRAVPVAAAVFLVHGATAIFKFGASDVRYQHLRPNNLVMWTAIQKLHAAGVGRLDFGRTDVAAEGLREFKQSWGAGESTLRYHTYDTMSRGFVAQRASRLDRIAPLIALLPLPLARCIGFLAYKHFA